MLDSATSYNLQDIQWRAVKLFVALDKIILLQNVSCDHCCMKNSYNRTALELTTWTQINNMGRLLIKEQQHEQVKNFDSYEFTTQKNIII